MAEVDPSIAVRAGQQPNFLESLGNVANTANTINQNRLFQQQFQTNRALSLIYKEAIDENGNIDPNKINKLIAEHPEATYGLPEAFAGAQRLRKGQLDITKEQLDLANAHYNNLASRLTALKAQPPGTLTTKDLIQATGSLIRDGLADSTQIQGEMANLSQRLVAAGVQNMPPAQAQAATDQIIRGFLDEIHLSTLDNQARLNAIQPAPGPVNVGGTTQFVRAPNVGAPSVAGALTNTLGPTTQKYEPGATAPSYVGDVGNGVQQMQLPPQGGTATGGGAPPPPASATGGPPGTVAAGLPAGAHTAYEGIAQNSVALGSNLMSAADRVPMMKATLSNLDARLSEFTPGPGSHSWKDVGAGLNMIAQSIGLQGFDASGIASQEDFDKQASMVAGEQFNMLGGTGTDAKLDAARTVSPNSYLSGQGNHRIIALLKGNADALQAKARAWNDWSKTHGPQTYGDFSTDFNKIYDPRVFQFQYLKPAERKDALDHMDLSERQQFVRSYNMAIDNGWVPPLKKK